MLSFQFQRLSVSGLKVPSIGADTWHDIHLYQFHVYIYIFILLYINIYIYIHTYSYYLMHFFYIGIICVSSVCPSFFDAALGPNPSVFNPSW